MPTGRRAHDRARGGGCGGGGGRTFAQPHARHDFAGLAAGSVGKIEIHDRFSYVAVAAAGADAAVAALRQGRIKGMRFRVDTLG